MKLSAGESDDISIAYTARLLGDEGSDSQLKIEALEAIARINPDDYENRFALAYAHSEIGSSDLALHHYLLIPSGKRDAITWNNLGVAFQELSVRGKSVAAFRKSAGEGETLAMSNLAYRLMNSGFLDEAGEEIKRAMKADEPHRNVGEAHAALSDIPETENKKLREIEEKVRPKAEFYHRLSVAALRPNIAELASDWVGPKGPITVRLDGTLFEAKWEYEVEGNALVGLLGSQKSKFRIVMNGNLCGMRAFGKSKRTRLTGPPSILGDLDDEQSFAIIFADDLESAQVAEGLEKKSPNYYKIDTTYKNKVTD